MKYALWFTILLLLIYIAWPAILPLWFVVIPVIIFGAIPVILFAIMTMLGVIVPVLFALAIVYYALKGFSK